MPNGKAETITEIEKLLTAVRKPRKPKPVVPEVEEPEAITGLERRLARGQTAVLTPEFAKALGLEVDFPEDWLMKVTPGKNGDEPIFSFRSPEGEEVPWEDILETPEGKWITKQQGEVLEAERVGEVSARADELTSLFKGVFPELLAPYTEEQAIEVTQAFLGQIIESPEVQEQFLETVQTQGRTPETERLLQILLPELTEEDLTGFFGVAQEKVRETKWWTLDFWLENFFKPYGGKDLKGKAAASFIAGIGDVISTTAGAARWLGYEDVGKTLSDIGTPLQRMAPPDTSGEFEIADLLDPEFYATKITRTIPFALSLAPLAIGGFYGGAAIASAAGIGTIGSWIIGGLAGAALSRPAESALEAGGAYDDAIARGKTEAEARKEADEVFRNNMVLAGADAWEIAIALAPTPKWVPAALVKGGLVRTTRVAGKMVIVGLSEGGEEVYQDMITRRARGEDWQLDPIAKEVFAIGAVMGMGMGLGGDVISSIVSKSKDRMTPEIKKDFDAAVSDFKIEGFTDEQAELRALDTVAETPEGEEVVKEAIKEVKPEVAPAVPEAVTPEVTPTEAPVTEIGEPEAGLQPAMIPEVPAKEVRPKAKAKIVQISMEDQLKLEQARQAAEEAVGEEKEVYEAQAEIESIKATLETDPIALKRIWIGKSKKGVDLYRGLDFFISLREQAFPEYFTVKQAKLLNPQNPFTKYTQPGLKIYNRVPRDEALDWMASEMGVESAEEIAERVMEIREMKRKLQTFEAVILAQFTEKPLDTIPEPTPAEVVISPTGEKMLTPTQTTKTLDLFGKYVESESVIDAWQLTRELRRETLAGRAEQLKNRAQELIVSEGIPAEEAMNQARRESMAGELPVVTTDYLSDLVGQMRETLFDKVYQTLQDEPFEMMSTAEALTNALLGKAIPREPGVKGGSAYTRLQRVFGDQPKVLKAIDTNAKRGKKLEDVVEGIFREWVEGGRPPIPVDQKMAEYLRGLSSDILYAPTAFRDPVPITRHEAPIEDAVKQVPMWPTPVRDNIIRVLKEIGWSPVDIGNFIRANKASFDMSYWRQQGPLILNHPVSFVQSNIEAWKALFSQKSAEASWERISRDPLYELYAIAEEAGYDFLRPLEVKAGTSQWRGVEEFGYITGERLIPKLTGKIPHVKLSARAFVTGTNEHNWRIYKNHYEAMLRLNEKYASGELKLKVGQAFSIEKEMIDMARLLADFTQRASLGRVSGIIPALNALIFAPRATLGRFLTPRHLISTNPHIRMEAWRNLTTFVGGIGSIVLLGNLLGLWEVEKDPKNAEFMSIRVGNVRVDPWSGYRQFLVFYTRVITGTGLSSVTGAEYDINPLMAMTGFVRGKAAPLASILLDFWVGKNFVGEEVDVANKRQWVERIAPFSLWDIYESYMYDPTTALQVAIPAIVGMGVQAYTGDWRENFPKLGLPKYSENLIYGLTEPYYDTADFWSDTSSQFAGVDPATLTKEKGFPPYIKAIAEARIVNEHLRTLPNEKLVSLNADPSKAEPTFAGYYQMWRDREKIVASGDEDALKAFDQDERTRNAEKGNFSQIQFALLNEYWAITDKEKQAEFLEEHKDEIGIKPRQDWLRSHPKENAQLAVWGQAKILTLEAYNEFNRLLKELDIPDNAIPEMTLPPEGSVENYFKYNEVLEEFSANSWEVQLIIAQDDGLREFLGREPIDTPVRSLELKIEHRSLFEQYDALETDEDRAKLKTDNPAWVDDMRRIEAIEHEAPDVTIDAWVDRGEVVDEFSAGSSEAKVWLLDNPEVHEWAIDQGLLTDDGSDWNENVLRLNVEMSKLDEESEEFKQLEIKKRAYQTVPEGMVDQYVEYYNLPEAGYRRERYLIENPEFTKEVDLKMPGAIPSVKYDELLEKADKTPEDLTRMKGYKLFVSEIYIDRFVEYDSIRVEGKPPDYPEGIRYYEDEWYLFDHPLYYKDIYLGLLGLDEVNFDNVPTPDQRRVYTKTVFSLYETLKGLQQGNARRDFEAKNPDLDLFMHIEFGTMLESERAKAEPKKEDQETKEPVTKIEGETAREKMQREIKELEERLKR